MQTISRTTFTTVKTEGGLLPADLLQRIADGADLDGLRPEDYHLLPTERLNEAINRAWNRCLGAWTAFNEQCRNLSESDTGTTLTRERWLLILFTELGYGRLPTVRSVQIDGDSYPISHMWENTPFHLVTFRQDLDRRSEIATAVRRSPHSLMQEFLNRSDEHLWGVIANGLQLRILRDNASLSRAAYVEFDLEAIMEGELYAEFSLLWLVCHQSRVEDLPEEDGAVPTCWLETWSKLAADQGARALDSLRDGVQEAIEALGHGVLAHRDNKVLKDRLRRGELSTQDLYQQLRRQVYRFIFLFVAEDRDLLLLPGTSAAVRALYEEHYSLHRLRELAANVRGGPHPDRYRQVRLLFALLREGYAPLGLPGLGSFLFSSRATPDLDDAEIANHDLLDAVRALAFTVENSVHRPVDYRNLDSEELGSVYESLLELHPQMNLEAATFALETAAGSERKTTGSYYTPTPLVNELLNSALEPVVAERLRRAEGDNLKHAQNRTQTDADAAQIDADTTPINQRESASDLRHPRSSDRQVMQEDAILSIKVLDYATGSGHMLIGAARRLARHLARIRSGDEEPAPNAIRHALREVVRHCIYGVDVNDTAVELCKVALWMESMEPGKPLSFLDKNIRQGNSLLGTMSLDDLEDGIPDDAYTAVTGDDKATASEFKKRNRKERENSQPSLFAQPSEENLMDGWRRIMALPEDTPDQVQHKQAIFERLHEQYSPWWQAQTACHLWTAAFFAEYTGNTLLDDRIATTADLEMYLANPEMADPRKVEYAWELAKRHSFFHWSIEFPDIHRHGGFDVILSNPPWERIKLQEKEWFASRDPEIANAPNSSVRRRLITKLETKNPPLHAAFQRDQHSAESESHFVRKSERYPLCGRGDVNTYTIFAELAYRLVGSTGRAAVIVPTGIATDDTTKYYFQNIMQTKSLVSLYDFENRRAIFPGVHRSYKFCLLTLTGVRRPAGAAQFVFFALDVTDLQVPEKRFSLTADEIALINPNTRTVPIFRSRRDAEINKSISDHVPVLVYEDSRNCEDEWGFAYREVIHMSHQAEAFITNADLSEDLFKSSPLDPLYEAKMVHHFDHRWSTYRHSDTSMGELDRNDPHATALPRYWVPRDLVNQRIGEEWPKEWNIGWRDITNATNERTVIFAVLPRVGMANTLPLALVRSDIAWLLPTCVSSFIVDYLARQRIGGTHLTMNILRQVPTLSPGQHCGKAPWDNRRNILQYLMPYTLELTYSAWDLQPFAQDCGYDGPPFCWDEERRFLLRCELDASYFHLYGIERDDVDYIMDTFPIVKRKDEAAHGEYRTKRVILEIYEEMAEAMRTGEPYQTRLDPPPADPSVAHAAK